MFLPYDFLSLQLISYLEQGKIHGIMKEAEEDHQEVMQHYCSDQFSSQLDEILEDHLEYLLVSMESMLSCRQVRDSLAMEIQLTLWKKMNGN